VATPEQLHELLKYCMEFGRTVLENSGEFYPFGAVIRSDGKLNAVGGWDGNGKPNPLDIHRLLADGFARQAADGSILAAALAANVNIPAEYAPPVGDGLRAQVEAAGFSRYIYVPYRVEKRGLFRKGFSAKFWDPIPVAVNAEWFVASK
jgi:hypothetical protein